MAETAKRKTSSVPVSDTPVSEIEGHARKTGVWSDTDIETLIEMWHMRFSNQDIGETLDRGANAVAIKASRLSLPPRNEDAKNSASKIRNCLRCRKSFNSDGPGNRICDTCKGSQDWQSGTDDYFMPMVGK